jgi:transposase
VLKTAKVLVSWLRSTTLRKSLAERSRIMLLSAKGQSAEAIGSKLDVSTCIVYKWRHRYREEGVGGLSDHPRPGQPRKSDAVKVEEILRLTTERIPEEATH